MRGPSEMEFVANELLQVSAVTLHRSSSGSTSSPVLRRFLVPFILVWLLPFIAQEALGDECYLRPVIHVLRHPGCVPKPIPSFACQGTCTSYVQVSASRFWQVERSCMCCQEMGEREATVGIFCPKTAPRFRKIITRAPVDCMCRPCTAVDEASITPQEIAGLDSRLIETNEVRDISQI